MRRLYKGKRTDNGEWIKGYLLVDDITGQYFIHASGNSVNESPKAGEEGVLHFLAYEIIPETVRECIGLKDKNGEWIFEDDILKGYQYPFYNETNNVFNYYAIVTWFELAFGLLTVKAPKATVRGVNAGNVDDMSDFDSDEWEIIGNIYDNPELYTTIPNYGR